MSCQNGSITALSECHYRLISHCTRMQWIITRSIADGKQKKTQNVFTYPFLHSSAMRPLPIGVGCLCIRFQWSCSFTSSVTTPFWMTLPGLEMAQEYNSCFGSTGQFHISNQYGGFLDCGRKTEHTKKNPCGEHTNYTW